MAPLLQPSSLSRLRTGFPDDVRQAWRLETIERHTICLVWAMPRDVADTVHQMIGIRRGFPVAYRRDECDVEVPVGNARSLVIYLIAEGYDVIPGSD